MKTLAALLLMMGTAMAQIPPIPGIPGIGPQPAQTGTWNTEPTIPGNPSMGYTTTGPTVSGRTGTWVTEPTVPGYPGMGVTTTGPVR
jgi:hypothetical protein